ncbi:hypothetical protein Aperf_G00000058853 [Anoplocephala perfoliata]
MSERSVVQTASEPVFAQREVYTPMVFSAPFDTPEEGPVEEESVDVENSGEYGPSITDDSGICDWLRAQQKENIQRIMREYGNSDDEMLPAEPFDASNISIGPDIYLKNKNSVSLSFEESGLGEEEWSRKSLEVSAVDQDGRPLIENSESPFDWCPLIERPASPHLSVISEAPTDESVLEKQRSAGETPKHSSKVPGDEREKNYNELMNNQPSLEPSVMLTDDIPVEGQKLKIYPSFNDAEEVEAPKPIAKGFECTDVTLPLDLNHSQESGGEADTTISTLKLPEDEFNKVETSMIAGYSGNKIMYTSEEPSDMVLKKSKWDANQSSEKAEEIPVDEKSSKGEAKILRDYANEESTKEGETKVKKSPERKAQEIQEEERQVSEGSGHEKSDEISGADQELEKNRDTSLHLEDSDLEKLEFNGNDDLERAETLSTGVSSNNSKRDISSWPENQQKIGGEYRRSDNITTQARTLGQDEFNPQRFAVFQTGDDFNVTHGNDSLHKMDELNITGTQVKGEEPFQEIEKGAKEMQSIPSKSFEKPSSKDTDERMTEVSGRTRGRKHKKSKDQEHPFDKDAEESANPTGTLLSSKEKDEGGINSGGGNDADVFQTHPENDYDDKRGAPDEIAPLDLEGTNSEPMTERCQPTSPKPVSEKLQESAITSRDVFHADRLAPSDETKVQESVGHYKEKTPVIKEKLEDTPLILAKDSEADAPSNSVFMDSDEWMKSQLGRTASTEAPSLKERPETGFNQFEEKMPEERDQNDAYQDQMESDVTNSARISPKRREDAKNTSETLGGECKMKFTDVPSELEKAKIAEPEMTGDGVSMQRTAEEIEKQPKAGKDESELVSPSEERNSDDNEILDSADTVSSNQPTDKSSQSSEISFANDVVPIDNQTEKTADIKNVQSVTLTAEESIDMSKGIIEGMSEKVDPNAADGKQHGASASVSSKPIDDATLSSSSLQSEGIASEFRTAPKDMPPQSDKTEATEHKVIEDKLPFPRREEKNKIQQDIQTSRPETSPSSRECDSIPFERISADSGNGSTRDPAADLVNSSHLNVKQIESSEIPSAQDGRGSKLTRTDGIEILKPILVKESGCGMAIKTEEGQSLPSGDFESAVSPELISADSTQSQKTRGRKQKKRKKQGDNFAKNEAEKQSNETTPPQPLLEIERRSSTVEKSVLEEGAKTNFTNVTQVDESIFQPATQELTQKGKIVEAKYTLGEAEEKDVGKSPTSSNRIHDDELELKQPVGEQDEYDKNQSIGEKEAEAEVLPGTSVNDISETDNLPNQLDENPPDINLEAPSEPTSTNSPNWTEAKGKGSKRRKQKKSKNLGRNEVREEFGTKDAESALISNDSNEHFFKQQEKDEKKSTMSSLEIKQLEEGRLFNDNSLEVSEDSAPEEGTSAPCTPLPVENIIDPSSGKEPSHKDENMNVEPIKRKEEGGGTEAEGGQVHGLRDYVSPDYKRLQASAIPSGGIDSGDGSKLHEPLIDVKNRIPGIMEEEEEAEIHLTPEDEVRSNTQSDLVSSSSLNRKEQQSKKARRRRNKKSKKDDEKAEEFFNAEPLEASKECDTASADQPDRSMPEVMISIDQTKIGDKDKIITDDGVSFGDSDEKLPMEKFVLGKEPDNELIQTSEIKVIEPVKEEESLSRIKKEAEKSQLTSLNEFQFHPWTDKIPVPQKIQRQRRRGSRDSLAGSDKNVPGEAAYSDEFGITPSSEEHEGLAEIAPNDEHNQSKTKNNKAIENTEEPTTEIKKPNEFLRDAKRSFDETKPICSENTPVDHRAEIEGVSPLNFKEKNEEILLTSANDVRDAASSNSAITESGDWMDNKSTKSDSRKQTKSADIKDNAAYSSENLLSSTDVEKNLGYKEDPLGENMSPLEPVMIQGESGRTSPGEISLGIAELFSSSFTSLIIPEVRPPAGNLENSVDVAENKEIKGSEEPTTILSKDSGIPLMKPSILEEALSCFNQERNEAPESDKSYKKGKNKSMKRNKRKGLEPSIGNNPSVLTKDQMLAQDYIELGGALEKTSGEENGNLIQPQPAIPVSKIDPCPTIEDQKDFKGDTINGSPFGIEATLSPPSIEMGASPSEPIRSPVKVTMGSPGAEIHYIKDSESPYENYLADEGKSSPAMDVTARQMQEVGEKASLIGESMGEPGEIPPESALSDHLSHPIDDSAQNSTSEKLNSKKRNKRRRKGTKSDAEVVERVSILPSTPDPTAKAEIEVTKGLTAQDQLDKDSSTISNAINSPPLEGKVNADLTMEEEKLQHPALVKSSDLSSRCHGDEFEAAKRIEAGDSSKGVLDEFKAKEGTDGTVTILEITEGIKPDPNHDRKTGLEFNEIESHEEKKRFNKQGILQKISQVDKKAQVLNDPGVLLPSCFEDPSRAVDKSEESSSVRVEQSDMIPDKRTSDISKSTSSPEGINEGGKTSTVTNLQDKSEVVKNGFESSVIGEKKSGYLNPLQQTNFRSSNGEREPKVTKDRNQESKDGESLADQRSNSILRQMSLDEEESTVHPSLESYLPEIQQIHENDSAYYYVENPLAIKAETSECLFGKDIENEHYQSEVYVIEELEEEEEEETKPSDSLNTPYSIAPGSGILEQEPELFDRGVSREEGLTVTKTPPKSSQNLTDSAGMESKRPKDGIVAPPEVTTATLKAQLDEPKHPDLEPERLSTKPIKKSPFKMEKGNSAELLRYHDDNAEATLVNVSEISRENEEQEFGECTGKIVVSESVPGESGTDNSTKDGSGAETKLSSGQKKRSSSPESGKGWESEEQAASSKKPSITLPECEKNQEEEKSGDVGETAVGLHSEITSSPNEEAEESPSLHSSIEIITRAEVESSEHLPTSSTMPLHEDVESRLMFETKDEIPREDEAARSVEIPFAALGRSSIDSEGIQEANVELGPTISEAEEKAAIEPAVVPSTCCRRLIKILFPLLLLLFFIVLIITLCVIAPDFCILPGRCPGLDMRRRINSCLRNILGLHMSPNPI